MKKDTAAKEPNWVDLSAKLPPQLIAKLLTFFVNQNDAWIDEIDTVRDLVRVAVEDCMLCASLTKDAQLQLTLYNAGAERLHREADPFEKILSDGLEEFGPNEKVADLLEKWAKKFRGSKKKG